MNLTTYSITEMSLQLKQNLAAQQYAPENNSAYSASPAVPQQHQRNFLTAPAKSHYNTMGIALQNNSAGQSESRY